MPKIYGYTVVAYPESMPDDWRIRLNSLPFGYCYNLHDKDCDVETGEKKKEHIHFFFQGVATKKQKEYIHCSLNVSFGMNVNSAGGMFDYLTHENNSDKYHYSKDSIVYSDKWSQELFDTYYTKTIRKIEIIDFIRKNRIIEYHALLEKLGDDNNSSWLDYCANHVWVRNYIDSLRYDRKKTISS